MPIRSCADTYDIALATGGTVSGLLNWANDPVALYVFTHGAGAGMGHPFMFAVASGLAARRVFGAAAR